MDTLEAPAYKQDTYLINLPQFEGPFDLLLFFIERDELDVYDIPISDITEEFLAYIREMEMLNIELASDFILVAATLMRIKAKMLIPRKELNELGEEIDPREELVRRLLEYKQYKEVSETLKQLEADRQLRNKRGNIQREVKAIADLYSAESELHSLTLFKLYKSFQKVMTRYEYEQNKPRHQVVQYNYTIKGQKEYLLGKAKKGKASFESVFETCESKIHAVFTFLAMLELLQDGMMEISIGVGFNNFWLSA